MTVALAIFASIAGATGLAAALASIRGVVRDGYGPVPTRHADGR